MGLFFSFNVTKHSRGYSLPLLSPSSHLQMKWQVTPAMTDTMNVITAAKESPPSCYQIGEGNTLSVTYQGGACKLCPVEWKNPLKDDWQMVLDRIIISESPESYVTEIRDTSGEIDPYIQFGAQKSSLLRRLKNAYGIDYKALLPLKSIYLVSIGGKKVISKISLFWGSAASPPTHHVRENP